MTEPDRTADEQTLAELGARDWTELRAALARATGTEPDDRLLPERDPDESAEARRLRLLAMARELQEREAADDQASASARMGASTQSAT